MIEYPRQMALRGCLQISIQPLVLLQRKTRQVPPVSSVGHSPPAVPKRWVHFYILFVGTWGLQLVSVLRLRDVALGLGYTLKITKVTAFHSEAWNPWKIVDAAVFRSIAFIVGPKKTSSNMDISNPETSSSIPDISSSYPEVSPLLSSQSACVGMFRMFLVHLTGSLATGVALVSVEMVQQQQQQQQQQKKKNLQMSCLFTDAKLQTLPVDVCSSLFTKPTSWWAKMRYVPPLTYRPCSCLARIIQAQIAGYDCRSVVVWHPDRIWQDLVLHGNTDFENFWKF